MRLVPRGKPDTACHALLTLCLPAINAVTPVILARVVGTLEIHCPGLARDAVQIVLGEVLNNVVEHGYRDAPLGSVTVSIGRRDRRVTVDIRDWGRAYPDLLVPSDDRPEPAELAEGGYGWFLIRALARDIRYRRDGCCNRLSLSIPA